MRIPIIALIIALLLSCHKKDPSGVSPVSKTNSLEIVWSLPISEHGSLSLPPFIHKNYVYFSNEHTGTLIGYPLDGKGELRVLAEGQFYGASTRDSYVLDDDKIYYRSSILINQLDLESDNITTLYEGDDRVAPRISFSGRKVYFVKPNHPQEILLSIDVDSRTLDTIYVHTYSPEWSFGLEPPTIFHYGGRQLLAFQGRGSRGTKPPYNRQDYYLYDEVADSMVWSRPFIDTAEGGVWPAVIHGDQIFWMGNTTVFALDAETGETNWQYENPDKKGHYHGYSFMHKGELMVKSDGLRMVALNPENGKTRWQNDNLGSTPAETAQVIGDTFYYYSQGRGKAVAVDRLSGERLLYADEPNAASMDGAGFVVDSTSGLIYYSDYNNVICAKINYEE